MKITSEVPDLNSVKYARPGKEIGSDIPKQIGNLDRQYIEAVISRLHMDRALGDALSAAQLSQSLMQKAMEVSSRLQNMASRIVGDAAVDSGKVKAAADETAILARHGAEVDRFSEGIKSNGGPSVPEVSSALGKLDTAVKTSAESGRLDEKSLEAAASSVKMKSAELISFSGDLSAGLPVKTDSGFSGADVSRVSRSVEANPSAALAAQGNLKSELVNQLLI